MQEKSAESRGPDWMAEEERPGRSIRLCPKRGGAVVGRSIGTGAVGRASLGTSYNRLFASRVQRCPVPTVHSAVQCKQEPRAKGHSDAHRPKEGPINEAGVIGPYGLSRAPVE
ncbi:hypothetical protein E5288_WYG012148 [Bos mutus]|uniref:Uncharacterized protein n=1 Tax=Bos mutus TaxID=72004 RepID=A0A6B0R8F0_9CETA|nr:hypothetical protein [Bos mutus]